MKPEKYTGCELLTMVLINGYLKRNFRRDLNVYKLSLPINKSGMKFTSFTKRLKTRPPLVVITIDNRSQVYPNSQYICGKGLNANRKVSQMGAKRHTGGTTSVFK